MTLPHSALRSKRVDFNRAASYATPVGKVARTIVSDEFAARIRQDGPLGQPEYFIGTEADAAIISQTVRVMPLVDAFKAWVSGDF